MVEQRQFGRNVAEQWIEAAIGEVRITSADKYYDWLRGHDLYTPRSDVREVWNEYRQGTAWIDLAARYPGEQILPRSFYGSTKSEYIEGYGYKLKMSYIDVETQETKTRGWLVKSDRALTKAEIDRYLREDVPATYPGFIQEVTEYKYVGLYHKAGTPW